MTAKTQRPKKPRKPEPKGKGQRVGPEAQVEAMRLLAEGFSLTHVAETMELTRMTVRRWRDSPDGQRLLDEARQKREAAIAEGQARAHRILRESLPRAAQAFVDALDDADAGNVLRAAGNILDREGIPRTERIETTEEPEDLSALSVEELEVLAAIRAKIGGPH